MNGTDFDQVQTTTGNVVSASGNAKLVKQVLLIPDTVVSMSILLNHKSTFRKHNGLSGKPLMENILNEISHLALGQVKTFIIPANKTKVINILTCFLLFRPLICLQIT